MILIYKQIHDIVGTITETIRDEISIQAHRSNKYIVNVCDEESKKLHILLPDEVVVMERLHRGFTTYTLYHPWIDNLRVMSQVLHGDISIPHLNREVLYCQICQAVYELKLKVSLKNDTLISIPHQELVL